MKVDEYQSLTPDSFTERYTALVQRLSLMLLQVMQDNDAEGQHRHTLLWGSPGNLAFWPASRY